jgi:hypothetical protein
MIKIIIISKDENSKSIEYILKFFKDYQIYLISPKGKESKYSESNLTKLNDNDILDFHKLKEELKLERFGWYYQQFLKYKSVLTLDGEDFLIIDGDTVIKPSLALRDTLFTTDKPTVAGYSNLYSQLFPQHKLNGKSFITNQMLFNKKYLQELVDKIEETNSSTWIEIVATLVKENKNMMFSEYQVYAEYLLNTKKDIDIKSVSVFRRMDLINDSVDNALKKFDIIAYENHHKTGLLRFFRAKMYYIIGKSIG